MEFRLQQKYSTILGVAKLKCTSAVTQWLKNYSWDMLCVEKDVTPRVIIVFLVMGCKEEEDKRLKIRGRRWTHTVKGIWNSRWEYYPHKSTITLSSSPLGTRPSCNWPTSVLCVADGRRSCPDESSWSPRWNPSIRLGNINKKKYISLTYTVSWNLAKSHLKHAETEWHKSSWGKSVCTYNSYSSTCIIIGSSGLCVVSWSSAELNQKQLLPRGCVSD